MLIRGKVVHGWGREMCMGTLFPFYSILLWTWDSSKNKIFFFFFYKHWSEVKWKSFSHVQLFATPRTVILQARTLEWAAISFSNAWKWKVKVKSLSHVRLFVTPWTAAHQAPLPMEFSRQEYWSGLPLPSPIFFMRHIYFYPHFLDCEPEAQRAGPAQTIQPKSLKVISEWLQPDLVDSKAHTINYNSYIYSKNISNTYSGNGNPLQ